MGKLPEMMPSDETPEMIVDRFIQLRLAENAAQVATDAFYQSLELKYEGEMGRATDSENAEVDRLDNIVASARRNSSEAWNGIASKLSKEALKDISGDFARRMAELDGSLDKTVNSLGEVGQSLSALVVGDTGSAAIKRQKLSEAMRLINDLQARIKGVLGVV
jgi:hypothetical protein